MDQSGSYNNMAAVNGTSRTMSIGASIDDRQAHRISKEIQQLEDELIDYKDEYILVREQLKIIMRTLGMEGPVPGQSIKMSSALKEIAAELDKRIDASTFQINPNITL